MSDLTKQIADMELRLEAYERGEAEMEARIRKEVEQSMRPFDAPSWDEIARGATYGGILIAGLLAFLGALLGLIWILAELVP